LVGRWWEALEAVQEDEDVSRALMVTESETAPAPFNSCIEVILV
jgi:hypothetical protein